MSLWARIATVLGLALGLMGCASADDIDNKVPVWPLLVTPGPETPVDVVYVTTRCQGVVPASYPKTPSSPDELSAARCWQTAQKNPEVAQLGFGMADGGAIHCGTYKVAIRKNDGAQRPTFGAQAPFDCSASFAAINARIAASPCKCALIYIHGFNTTFASGLMRTAQLKVDLEHQGVPILFSFGSGGRVVDYANDIEATEAAAPQLRRLLQALSPPGSQPAVDVIAHSMGNRLFLRALTADGENPKLRFVIMAAPDVDQDAFIRMAKAASPLVERMTVYTAEGDVALTASRGAHGGWRRAGDDFVAGLGATLDRADVIDATVVADDAFGHSYFGDSKPVLTDIKAALQGQSASQRWPTPSTPGAVAPCNSANAPRFVYCRLACPDGETCRRSFFTRIINWLFD